MYTLCLVNHCKLFSILQSNTHTGTFYLIESLHSQSPPSCNVHFCVRQYQYIGCKKSFDCVLTIPSNGMLSRAARSLLPRATQSYEEPSKQLLEICEQESDSVVLLCADRMWDIFYTTGYAIGEVSLRINLQGNDKVSYPLSRSVIVLNLPFIYVYIISIV